MLIITKAYLLVFGILTIAGGVMGFVKASSTASLIAGGISGILLLVAWYLLPARVVPGLALGLVVSLALAARFLPAFFAGGKFMPAGMMAILGAVGVVLTIAALVKR